ncbi:hypothetical protein [Roseomonas sp. WA12]
MSGLTTLAKADLYGLRRLAIAQARTQDAWAKGVGVSASYVSEVQAARKPFSPRMLAALGVERVTIYRLLDPATQPGDAAAITRGMSAADRRTLLWLPADGSPRKRLDAVAGDWRRLLENLKRLRGMRLAEEIMVEKVSQGWAATEAGLVARDALRDALHGRVTEQEGETR